MTPGIVCCKNCSKQLPAAATFCRRCGWRTADAAPAARDIATTLRAVAAPVAAPIASTTKLPEIPEEAAPTIDDLRPAPLNWLFKLLDPSVWFVALAAGVVLTLDGCVHRADQPRGLRAVLLAAVGTTFLLALCGSLGSLLARVLRRGPRGRFAISGTAVVLTALLAFALLSRTHQPRRSAFAGGPPSPSDGSQGPTSSLPENGMWRQVKTPNGDTVSDFLVAGYRDVGVPPAPLQWLPDADVHQMRVSGKRGTRGLELVITNPRGLGCTLRQVTVRVTTWQGARSTRTEHFRLNRAIAPGETAVLEAPLTRRVRPGERVEYTLVAAAVDAPRPRTDRPTKLPWR